MKRSIAIILLSVYMMSFSELPQILKVPVLVQHFLEHRSADPGITFWAFIKEHYQGKIELDEDYKRDNELPFRTTNIITSTIVFFDPPTIVDVPVSVPEIKQEFPLFNDTNNPISSPGDIFQPPRAGISC